MLRMTRAAVFTPALAVALGFGLLAAPAQASSHTVTLRIAGIGRDGKSAQVDASVVGANGYFPTSGIP
jgi:hypothetical protein